MEIKVLKAEDELQENCYVLTQGEEALVIDPGCSAERILEAVQDKKLLAVFVTHHHFDHVVSLEKLLFMEGVSLVNFSTIEECHYQIGSFSYQVLFTPGHSKDSVTYYFSDNACLFTGDFLFQGTVGRCDLPGGDWNCMVKSIEKIRAFSEEIEVYPGHGDATTIGIEKKYNPYF